MFKTAKPFNTDLRRFAVGDRLYRSDVLAPHTLESLTDGGFVENELAKPVKEKPTK